MSETVEAKIRNLISPYFNLIKMIENLQDPTVSEDDKKIIVEYLMETADTKSMMKSCNRLIHIGAVIDAEELGINEYV